MSKKELQATFMKSVEKYLDEVFMPFIENLQMDERVKKAVKYEHDYDYWLGYVTGVWEGTNIQLFKTVFNREINEQERFELEEIFELKLSKIRDILKTKL